MERDARRVSTRGAFVNVGGQAPALAIKREAISPLLRWPMLML